MKPSKRNSLNSSYNPVIRMYENAVGKFLTYAEAKTKTMAMRENGAKCSPVINH